MSRCHRKLRTGFQLSVLLGRHTAPEKVPEGQQVTAQPGTQATLVKLSGHTQSGYVKVGGSHEKEVVSERRRAMRGVNMTEIHCMRA